MAVKLRLVRMGKKKQPTYRLVAADSRAPRDGRFLEVVGTYAPRGRSVTDRDPIVSIDTEKAQRWLSQGAQPTERAARLLVQVGAMAPDPKSKIVAKAPKAPAPAAAPAPAPAVAEAPAAEAEAEVVAEAEAEVEAPAEAPSEEAGE